MSKNSISLLVYLLLMSSCSSIPKECKPNFFVEKGRMDAVEGRSPRGDFFASICNNSPNQLEESYSFAYKISLSYFCTEERAQKRAKEGLEKELICENDIKYRESYDKALAEVCKEDKSMDPLSPHLPCFKVEGFKENFNKNLESFCTSEKAFNLGYKREDFNYCSGFEKFKENYDKGMTLSLKEENEILSSQAQELEKKIKNLKYQVTLEKREEPKQNLIDKLESLKKELLSARHQIEQNKIKLL